MNSSLRFSLRRAGFGAAGLLAAASLFAMLHAAAPADHPALAIKRDDSAALRSQVESASYAAIVKRVAPSVVKITVQMQARNVSFGSGEGSTIRSSASFSATGRRKCGRRRKAAWAPG
jgi:S1-C subfamily serine protease